MTRLFGALAIAGTAALMLAYSPPAEAKSRTDGVSNIEQTEFSSRRRWRNNRGWRRGHGWRRGGYGYYRPRYYRPYRYGYYPRYYAPGVSFGFGFRRPYRW